MLAVDSCVDVRAFAMPVIDVDECRRFVLYLRFYSRLQLHVEAPGLLASVLQDASLPMLKPSYDDSALSRDRRD